MGSSSRTRGRLVMTIPRCGTPDPKAKTVPIAILCNLASWNVLTGLGRDAGSLRHVQRRVQLTLGLGRREAGAGFTATKPERQLDMALHVSE